MTKLIDVGSLVYSKMIVDYGDIFIPLKDISDAPAVDAVQVVRCKDCKYSSPADDFLCGFKCNVFKDSRFTGEWYCAGGERKDGENDANN